MSDEGLQQDSELDLLLLHSGKVRDVYEVDARTLRGLAGGVPKDSARHHRELALATLFIDLRPGRVDFA